MAEPTRYFADSPDDQPGARPSGPLRDPLSGGDGQDALSDVLDAIHLRGASVTRVEGAVGHRDAHPVGSRVLYLVESGVLRVRCSDGSGADLLPGDMALLARGDGHVVVAREESSWVTGLFSVEATVARPVLDGLAPVIVVPHDDATRTWLPLSFGILLDELTASRPGARVMALRILDVLFIQAVRHWAASDDVARPGVLLAALDDVVGPVLAALHQRLDDDWSVPAMARMASMSSSAFTSRFRALTGLPPATYLSDLRLDRAAHRLLDGTEAVSSVARSVGYRSDAAFSRAFARRHGTAPAAYRRRAGRHTGS